MIKNYFVYGCDFEEEISSFREFDFASQLLFISLEDFLKQKDATENDKVIIYGYTDEIKTIFEQSFVYGFSMGIISRPSQWYLRDTFDIPKDPKEALQVILEAESKTIDLIYAHDEIVLWSALVGEAPPHGIKSTSYITGDSGSRIKALYHAFKKIRTLKKSKVTITTEKKQEVNTIVSGIVVVQHDDHSCAANLVKDFISLGNGKVLSLLISPASVMDYFKYLYSAIFQKTKFLPTATGIIMSQSVRVESQPAMNVQIDGEIKCKTPITFEVHHNAVRLCASKQFWEKEAYRQSDDKEVIKLGGLPTSKDALDYSSEHIPFFTHADTQQYKDLFVTLREEARASSTFITLMILSTLLATVGLFLNSASVIIGAMLLAPLMQPIVSFAMGLLRFDMDLFWHGLKSVFLGIMLVLFAAALLSLWLPFQDITSQMQGRLHPSLLDLIVAIVSGIAAAYAKTNTKIIGSLVGVSIAVALVPPVATAGIGIGWGNWNIFQNAFLLFLTNFAGIVFAAALTFVILGFSPIRRAKNALFFSFAFVLVISIPLYMSFFFMVNNAQVKEILNKSMYMLGDKNITIENINIQHDRGNYILRCELISNKYLNDLDRKTLKQIMKTKIKPYIDDETFILESVQRLRT